MPTLLTWPRQTNALPLTASTADPYPKPNQVLLSMKKLAIAAAAISCCIANAMPAKANVIANANKFCSSVVNLNNVLKFGQRRCQGFFSPMSATTTSPDTPTANCSTSAKSSALAPIAAHVLILPVNPTKEPQMKKLAIAAAATVGLAVGSLATTAFTAAAAQRCFIDQNAESRRNRQR